MFERKLVVCFEVGICLCGYNFDARYLPSTEAVALGESKFCGVGASSKVYLGIYFRTFLLRWVLLRLRGAIFGGARTSQGALQLNH